MTVPEVDATAGHDLVTGGALLVDVRNADEWEAGHAPGAVFLPLPQLADRVAELPVDRKVVVICRSGARSGKATALLCGQGFDAMNLAGGMQAWAAAAYPVVTDSGVDGSVI